MAASRREPSSAMSPETTQEAAPRTRANVALARMLADNPWHVRFFQMVRMLERLHPERKPVGIFVAPADEYDSELPSE